MSMLGYPSVESSEVYLPINAGTVLNKLETYIYVKESNPDSGSSSPSTQTIPVASSTENGLMSSQMFTKLSKIEEGANKYVLPDLSSTYASLDSSGKVKADKIPDLSSKYAPLTSNKISETVIPDLSGTYAKLTNSKVNASVIPDLSKTYAKLTDSKVNVSVIPDLSGTYAKLTDSKISDSAVPDLSAKYASLSSGKIKETVIPDLSSKYAPLSEGKISKDILPEEVLKEKTETFSTVQGNATNVVDFGTSRNVHFVIPTLDSGNPEIELKCSGITENMLVECKLILENTFAEEKKVIVKVPDGYSLIAYSGKKIEAGSDELGVSANVIKICEMLVTSNKIYLR